MGPECVEYVRALVSGLSKAWRIFVKEQRNKFAVLTVQPNQSTSRKTHIHVCACVFVGSWALIQTTQVQNLFLIRATVYFFILFLHGNNWKGFFVSVNNKFHLLVELKKLWFGIMTAISPWKKGTIPES